MIVSILLKAGKVKKVTVKTGRFPGAGKVPGRVSEAWYPRREKQSSKVGTGKKRK